MSGRSTAMALLAAAALASSSLASAPGAQAADAPPAPVILSPLWMGVDPSSQTGLVPIVLDATPTAARVGVVIDGWTLATSVPGPGTTTFLWPTWGYPTGTTRIEAFACSAAGDCSDLGGSSVMVNVFNLPPVLTAPAAGSVLTGRVPVSATAPEGAIGFVVGGAGALLGYDDTAPYSAMIDVGLVPDGMQTIQAVRCSSRAHCSGPRSAPVAVVTRSLHPTTTGQAPLHFSPNGDRVLDTSTTSYRLAGAWATTVTVTTPVGSAIRGPVKLGILAAGAHRWTWDGRDNVGKVAPDGSYRVVIRTRAGGLYGVASRAVGLDTTAPSIGSVAGSGTLFYPVHDFYRDSFRPTFVMSEAGTATMRVTSSSGVLVRRLSTRTWGGITSMSWSGRTAAHKLLPAGTYSWRLTARDLAGNSWTSPRYTVRISWKKLVEVTVTATVDGGSGAGSTSTAPCAETAPSSFGTVGVLLSNSCDYAVVGAQTVESRFVIRVPNAIAYGSVTLKALGTITRPATVYGWVRAPGTDPPDVMPPRTVTLEISWVTLGMIGDLGSVSAAHTVEVAVGVAAGREPPHAFDLRSVRVVVRAEVLR